LPWFAFQTFALKKVFFSNMQVQDEVKDKVAIITAASSEQDVLGSFFKWMEGWSLKCDQILP
jgi:hypothetical protein